jgi:hypothetical protein
VNARLSGLGPLLRQDRTTCARFEDYELIALKSTSAYLPRKRRDDFAREVWLRTERSYRRTHRSTSIKIAVAIHRKVRVKFLRGIDAVLRRKIAAWRPALRSHTFEVGPDSFRLVEVPSSSFVTSFLPRKHGESRVKISRPDRFERFVCRPINVLRFSVLSPAESWIGNSYAVGRTH